MKKYDPNNNEMLSAVFSYAEDNENKCNVADVYMALCGALGAIHKESFADQIKDSFVDSMLNADEVEDDIFTLRDKVGSIIWGIIKK